jgi:hypothetical protein
MEPGRLFTSYTGLAGLDGIDIAYRRRAAPGGSLLDFSAFFSPGGCDHKKPMKTTLTRRLLICTGLLGLPMAVAMADDTAATPAAQSTDSGAAVQAGASDKPEFRGMLTTGKEKRFLLSTPGASHSEWEVVGDSFQGWKLVEFRDADGILVLRQGNGTELSLSMAGKKVAPGEIKATVEDADRVLKKMHFSEMMAKMLEQQKQTMAQMFARQGGKLPPGTTREEMAAFQSKVLDKVFSQIQGSDLEKDVAKIYSNVFTPDELSGLADFYDTPTGQALTDKQPQLQQQMMQVMMPRMMAIQPEIQQMTKDFMAQQAAKAAAAPAPAPASAPAPAPTP